ncbi:lysine--tRNA ligase [Nakamurella aerolata]|uniref:Lysine--tRNA ligase n=1 Tax=Nakamurella aerolata TaxID=1656892 RepID=A0A849A3X9_9ACTN|nr:lysine--tRNA ligase [Nakamurella aerolata]
MSRLADEVIADVDRRGKTGPIICASGLSPSGPVHLGNFRELITPHLVADEIRRRGRACEHILSWDDYDRFRRVPAGVDPSWEQHIGKPLTAVPAPPGSPHPNWAEHFKAPLRQAMAELGIVVREISQTQMYTSGAYTDQILEAVGARKAIDNILDRYRTKQADADANAGSESSSDADSDSAAPAGSASDAGDTAATEPGTGARRRPGAKAKGGKQNQKQAKLSDEERQAAELAAEGSGAADEDDGSSSASLGYFPYKPYCTVCGKDFTTVTSYDDVTTELSYSCRNGHSETVLLKDFRSGKLVWKVDWPMRWRYEGVDFEPSGVDHQSPGSSYVVGGQIVTEIFGGSQPLGPMYAFVGITGMAKMSSSRGNVPIPLDALQVMEGPVLRWMYARRRPNQSFTIAFDAEIFRVHDEFDALRRKVSDGSAGAAEAAAYSRAVRTAERELPLTPRPLPYRMLASVLDITTGDDAQTQRILSQLDPADPITDLDQARPRLDRAAAWVQRFMPADSRTHVRTEPDTELLTGLDERQRRGLQLLLAGLSEHWSLEGLTSLLYGVPKQLLDLPADTKPTPELKAAQREFFVLLYRLLVGTDTGPRLPTLLLAVGERRVRQLLGG